MITLLAFSCVVSQYIVDSFCSCLFISSIASFSLPDQSWFFVDWRLTLLTQPCVVSECVVFSFCSCSMVKDLHDKISIQYLYQLFNRPTQLSLRSAQKQIDTAVTGQINCMIDWYSCRSNQLHNRSIQLSHRQTWKKCLAALGTCFFLQQYFVRNGKKRTILREFFFGPHRTCLGLYRTIFPGTYFLSVPHYFLVLIALCFGLYCTIFPGTYFFVRIPHYFLVLIALCFSLYHTIFPGIYFLSVPHSFLVLIAL